jgi:hypothetical protein
MIITSKSVSIWSAWVESASPNQLNWTSTTDITAASAIITATRRTSVARVTRARFY